MSKAAEINDHIARARRYYDDPSTLRLMQTDEMFSAGFWHTEFSCEYPGVGRLDENAFMARRLGASPESHILDFSCGVGGFSRYLVEAFSCRMSGLNISTEQVSWARSVNSCAGKIDFQTYDGHRFPFPDAHFDAIASQETLCQVPNRPGIFRELSRVLKPSGVLCIQDWFASEELAPTGWATWIEPINKAFVTRIGTMSEYAALLREAGFTDVKAVAVTELSQFAWRGNGNQSSDRENLGRCETVKAAQLAGAWIVGFVTASKQLA